MTSLAATQNSLNLEQAKALKKNGLENLVNHLFKTVQKVQHNLHTRKQLATLSCSALKDIGLTQADVCAELNKPIWK